MPKRITIAPVPLNIASVPLNVAPVPLNRVEVSVHRSYEDYAPAQMPGQYGRYRTFLDMDSQSLAQDQSFGIDDDLENGVEKS